MKKRVAITALLLAIVLLTVAVPVALADDDTVTATQHRRGIRGQVTAVSGQTITVQTRQGEVSVITDENTTFRISGVENPTIADVTVGSRIGVLGRWEEQALHARVVLVMGEQHGRRVMGQVTDISGSDITVDTRNGDAVIVHTDADTYHHAHSHPDGHRDDYPHGHHHRHANHNTNGDRYRQPDFTGLGVDGRRG
jgi:RNase P/RNase MRP subunit p29